MKNRRNELNTITWHHARQMKSKSSRRWIMAQAVAREPRNAISFCKCVMLLDRSLPLCSVGKGGHGTRTSRFVTNPQGCDQLFRISWALSTRPHRFPNRTAVLLLRLVDRITFCSCWRTYLLISRSFVNYFPTVHAGVNSGNADPNDKPNQEEFAKRKILVAILWTFDTNVSKYLFLKRNDIRSNTNRWY